MDTCYSVGSVVEHEQFGRGRVLGLSEKKGIARINFDKIGVKELNVPEAKLQPAEADSEVNGEEAVRLSYNKAEGNASGCRWLLNYKDESAVSLIHDIRTWTNAKVSVEKDARIEFDSSKKGEVELKINGNGRDGRCRWCRTYRTALKTAARRKYGRGGYAFNGGCPFA